MTKYSLYMIRHAWIASAESVLIRGGSPEKRIPIGCYSWLLRNTESGELLLVDTGPADMDVLNSTVTAGGAWQKTGSLTEFLSQKGIAAEDISSVILTHCHYDHSSGAGLFKNAELVMNGKEASFISSADNHQYGVLGGLRSLAEEKRREGKLLETGEDCMYKGLRLIRAGGHTPGSTMVQAETPQGPVLLTGDAIFLRDSVRTGRPIGMAASPGEAEKAAFFCGSFEGTVLTGHDMSQEELFDKEGCLCLI